jgi:hypothetical protein
MDHQDLLGLNEDGLAAGRDVLEETWDFAPIRIDDGKGIMAIPKGKGSAVKIGFVFVQKDR